MRLDKMSIADLQRLRLDLGIIERAAEHLQGLLVEGDAGEVWISLQPGEMVRIASAWVMPLCGGCEMMADPGPLVIEEAPAETSADGMAGGSGDLQHHRQAESPPAAPAASTPETGESPEESRAASAAPGGDAGLPVSPPGDHASDAPVVIAANRQDPWTEDEEAHLVALVAERMAAGDTRKQALVKVSELLHRTAATCDLRLRKKFAGRLEAAIRQHREARAKRASAALARAADAVRAPQPPAAPPAPRPVPAAVAGEEPKAAPLTIAQRAILDALARVPAREGFDDELDLEVMEGYARGAKTAALALDLDVEAGHLAARMRELTACIRDERDHLTIDGQRDLMIVLRHKVREGRVRAA